MMNIDELQASDTVIQNILKDVAGQIDKHEKLRPGEYAATEQRTSWNRIRLQLYEKYECIVKQREELVASFTREKLLQSSVFDIS